jgi:hypothetical protein
MAGIFQIVLTFLNDDFQSNIFIQKYSVDQILDFQISAMDTSYKKFFEFLLFYQLRSALILYRQQMVILKMVMSRLTIITTVLV